MSASARITIEPAHQPAPEPPKRRRHSLAEKRQMVEESFQPGASVARVARAHALNANQLFTWRRLYQRGQLGGATCAVPVAELLPVTIADAPAAPAPLPTPTPLPLPVPAGTIQLQTARGRLRIEGIVDPDSLRVVLECLLR